MTSKIKAKWAAKLMRSKHFVVLTDKESVICIKGVNPNDITDFVTLAAQTAELQNFSISLQQLIKDHDVAIRKLSGIKEKRAKKKNTPTKRGKKINVKTG